MGSRSYLQLLLGALLVGLSACDFSNGDATTGPAPGPGPITGPGDCLEVPFLTGQEGLDDEICVGDRITIFGVNISPFLDENQVIFRGTNNSRIPGVPVALRFPTDGDCSNGLESEMEVVVPGGVVSGNLEVTIGGISAGGFGYFACPQIYSVGIDRDGLGEAVAHLGILGFDPNSFVQIWGVNLNEIEIILTDTSGSTPSRIPRNAIQRNPSGGGGTSGLANVGFGLNDGTSNVTLNIQDPRENVGLVAQSEQRPSNRVEFPVVRVDLAAQILGAVINGVLVPTGATGGPVRIRYTMYDQIVDASWNVLVQWRVGGDGSASGPWINAAPDLNDPLSNGTTGILPGTLYHQARHALLRPGAERVFTWDPLLDDNFPPASSTGGLTARQVWPIQFRLVPTLENGTRGSLPPHTFVTPAIVVEDLVDPAETEPGPQTRGELGEPFDNLRNADTSLTDASWAVPSGSLEGPPSGSPAEALTAQFGSGVEDVVLNLDPAIDPANLQVYAIDTDRVQIRFTEIDLGDDPADPSDDVLRTTVRPFVNPGASVGEFHFRSFTLGTDVLLIGVGARPVIMRLSGEGEAGDPTVPVFVTDTGSVFELSGVNGNDGPVDSVNVSLPSAGGAGGPGAGAGGNGGQMTLGSTLAPIIAAVIHAGDGGNQGGMGGETTGAVDYRGTSSRIPGGPGGGGGNRGRGGDGAAGNPAPSEYNPPRAGLGGLARGDRLLLTLPAGSGGGGGGAALSVRSVGGQAEWAAVTGAGGGGGGGALQVTANGSMQIDGVIRADGGNGGNGVTRAGVDPRPTNHGAPGAGGGGSGGSILLQAAGFVEVTCSQLSVLGGRHGVSDRNDQNEIPGSGDGAPGWVRVEASLGPVPSCGAVFAETTLASDLSATETAVVNLTDASGFPAPGVAVVVSRAPDPDTGGMRDIAEEVAYRYVVIDTTGQRLEGLERGFNGTPVIAHSASAARVFYKGAIVPLTDGVLAGGGVAESPDAPAQPTGSDGTLHFVFIPTIDTETGEIVADPETGRPLAVYEMNTDTGVILNPSGGTFRTPSRQSSRPNNVLDLTQLIVDRDAVLRARGSKPLIIEVAVEADIAGWIDVSGVAGGLISFPRDDRANPRPGSGGAAGAGGGDGGDGGTIVYRDGDSLNKDPANTIPANAGRGHLPQGFGSTPAEEQLVPDPDVFRSQPGLTLRGQDCDNETNPGACTDVAGGGGGGGNLRAGVDGEGDAGGLPVGGAGGSPFGISTMRFAGGLWPYGGLGGGGGGGTPHISAQYRDLQAGDAVNRGLAVYAPGTGGGGGGGMLALRARYLLVRASAQIRARGGDAFQTIDLGGNGGGGAGGNVLLQFMSGFNIEPGARIDVSGGTANRAVPIDPNIGLPIYEGNVRLVGQTLVPFGGLGGDGAPGRIRIEAPSGADDVATLPNPSLTGGPFLVGTVRSVAVSTQRALGIGSSGFVSSFAMRAGEPLAVFNPSGQPVGTEAVVLWQGAGQSLDQIGTSGTLSPWVEDPTLLRESEYVRFQVIFLSDPLSNRTQSIDEITLPYSLDLVLPPGS